MKLSEFRDIDSIFFEDDFRENLFKKATKEAGSKHQLAYILAYFSHSNVNWIIYGKQGIPIFRLTYRREVPIL